MKKTLALASAAAFVALASGCASFAVGLRFVCSQR